MGFRIETLNPQPPCASPFNHDFYNMGTRLGVNCVVMYENHPLQACRYLILVNTDTGERIRVSFEASFYKKLAVEIDQEIELNGGSEIDADHEFVFTLDMGQGTGWIQLINENQED